jgi:hypothetical protein
LRVRLEASRLLPDVKDQFARIVPIRLLNSRKLVVLLETDNLALRDDPLSAGTRFRSRVSFCHFSVTPRDLLLPGRTSPRSAAPPITGPPV